MEDNGGPYLHQIICFQGACSQLAPIGEMDTELEAEERDRWPYIVSSDTDSADEQVYFQSWTDAFEMQCDKHGIQAYYSRRTMTIVRIRDLSVAEAVRLGSRTVQEHRKILSKWARHQIYRKCCWIEANSRRSAGVDTDGPDPPRIALAVRLRSL